MIPRYFAYRIIFESLSGMFPLKQVETIMATLPAPTEHQSRISFVRELVAFVNSDNRYKLCVVNRRNCRWAIFIITPYGVVKTDEISYALGIPYEATYDSAVANDMEDLADKFEEVGFNSTVIASAFIDDIRSEI